MTHAARGVVDPRRERLLAARLQEPLAYLGLQRDGDGGGCRAYLPHAARAWLATGGGWSAMRRDAGTDRFEWRGAAPPPRPGRLRAGDDRGSREFADPYGFAPMLYLDYSRAAGEWVPNRYGGRENLEAIDFLRQLNTMVHGRFPGAVTIAEESTAWQLVSRPVDAGGRGFSMKWNMGRMHDTLEYLRHEPVHRRLHHRLLTFGQPYAYSENFVLPLSHDEVVHGKGSLLGKMPGDAWQQFANVRLLLAYQMAYPGKKLDFMGNEFAQGPERSEARELRWAQRDGSFVCVAPNFTPVPRRAYALGMPAAGSYRELINTASRHCGGGDVGNAGEALARPIPAQGQPASLSIVLPPLGGVVFAPVQN